MSDLFTIMWKEWKDTLFQGGWKAWIRPAMFIGVLGVVLPLVDKPTWMSLSPTELVICIWCAFFVIISFVGDSIAGERERHTLETLLASRVPDSAILLGKVAMVVLYGWGMMAVSLFVGVGVSNATPGQEPFAFYPIDMLLFTLVLGLLVGTLGASVGVLISLHISTVRQAQQVLSIGTLVLGVAIPLLAQVLGNFFQNFTPDQILLMVVGVVALLDGLLLAFALARFQRAKLILG